jgi:TonB-dependent receptor
VSKKLAFTLAVAQSFRPSEMQFMFAIWDQVNGFQTYHRPSYAVFNEERTLGEISATWKIDERQTLQLGFQATSSDVYTRQFQQIAQMVGGGVTGGPTFSQGSLPATDTASQAVPWVTQYRSLKAGNVAYQFEGSKWKINANASWSEAGTRRKDTEDGFFGSVSNTLTGLNLRFDGVNSAAQRTAAVVTATNSAGNPVDIYDGSNYSITAANSAGPLENTNTVKRIELNVRREFDAGVPLSIKMGALVSRNLSVATGGAFGYSFSPPGGAAGQRVGNYDLIDESFSASHSFSGANSRPVSIKWISPYKLYNLYRAHPEYFTFSLAQQANQYISRVNTSKRLQETIPAGYVRGDVKLFENRLSLTGGVRFEQTQDEGYGPRNDIGATYQKDAQGNFVRNAAGRLVAISTDAMVTAKLRYTELGTHARRTYEGYYPSLNSSFEITKDLLVRAAYAKTIGRPNLSLIIPGLTIADPDATAALKTITVVNTALAPWTANNYDLTLELYNVKGATASISTFQKDIKNFFGTIRAPAASDLLAEIGLTDDYLGYDIVTQKNFGAATIKGIELAYRQSLAPFVPSWAKGLEFLGSATTLALSGPNASDFTKFSPHEASGGVSYVHRKFIAKVNVQRSGWIRGAAAAASATVPSGAYNYVAPQTRVDVSAEYRLTKNVSVYTSVRNLYHTAKRQGIRGPAIPAYTELNYYQFTGTLLTVGLKGQF